MKARRRTRGFFALAIFHGPKDDLRRRADVELMHAPNPHASGYLATYLPKENIIFESEPSDVALDFWDLLVPDAGVGLCLLSVRR